MQSAGSVLSASARAANAADAADAAATNTATAHAPAEARHVDGVVVSGGRVGLEHLEEERHLRRAARRLRRTQPLPLQRSARQQ